MLGTDIFQQRLFCHGFVSLVHSGHHILTKGLLREAFESLPHAVVHADGRSLEIVEPPTACMTADRAGIAGSARVAV